MAKIKERFFIAYDFTSDSRRAKFVKSLEKYGIRIQYSLFEFDLTVARKIELFARLKKYEFLQNKDGESVIIIPIFKDSLQKIERYGKTVDIFDKSAIFLV